MKNQCQECTKLHEAIRKHHSQKGDDRCILDDDELYKAAGLPPADHHVGDKLAMVQNCIRFIQNRCEGGKWPSYAQLEKENKELQDKLQDQTTKEWDCHEHKNELIISKQTTIYHPHHGQLSYCETTHDAYIYHPIIFLTTADAHKWIKNGTIAELQEGLHTLNIGFTTKSLITRKTWPEID